MTPEERAREAHAALRGASVSGQQVIADAIRVAVLEEREQCAVVVTKYLHFTSQRAVSWHEVNDAIEAIRKRRDT